MKKRTFEELKEESLKYSRRVDFAKGNPSAYNAARKTSNFDEICSHMGPSLRRAPTLEELIKEALIYRTRGEFKKNSPNKYKIASKRTDFDQICQHMGESLRKSRTDFELHKEAMKYESRIDFIKGSHNQYEVARQRGPDFLNLICSHMKYPTISSPERTILEEIRKHFPEASKFRATKLKISGKPHLKWLEVDILVKSLGRAIEYDSERYHSFESLKKGHPTWPIDDVEEYHEIKDFVFLSLGIKILHIKEKEWNVDHRACIDKCLVFLRGDLCP